MISAGVLVIILGKFLMLYEPVEWNDNFYRQGRGGTLLHSGIALLWTSLFIGFAHLKTSNLFFKLLEFVSKHITIIYVVQWVIIMWMFLIFGYNQLPILPSLFAVFVTSTLSFSIARLLTKKPSLKNTVMKPETKIYDIAGIGIGPFNLGLAALTAPVNNLNTIFIEQKSEFNWHEGMLIPEAHCRFLTSQTW
ncbi:lysine N(6)-hydroxylase/L-ornithine N(5)-oxygenase family protein [Niabella hibiscisoli]|nr:SidA/IucD/PvdA family monooxygenase [Niabella hibiscisoli]MCH5719930.1 lysine N(6)-hydroxylase/L-ornithine N(5)-oxygenase family protein [Niabella hibiscisoli]